MRHGCKRDGGILSYSSTPINSYYCFTLANMKIHSFRTCNVRTDAVKNSSVVLKRVGVSSWEAVLVFSLNVSLGMTNDKRKGKFITQKLADSSSTT